MTTETLMTTLALPNSSRITNAFDSVGRLTSTRLLSSSSSLLAQLRGFKGVALRNLL